MAIQGLTHGEIGESFERKRKLDFFKEAFEAIDKIFLENSSNDISALKAYLNDAELFKRLEEACVGKFSPEEEALIILEGKFYVYGDEFTEDEISKIVSAYIEDEDIEEYIDFFDSLSSVGEEDEDSDFSFAMVLANFPGNIIGKVVEKIRNTPLCREIRDRIDRINGM